MVEVEIDYKVMEEKLNKGIENALEELAQIFLKYARANHKYQDREGTLTKSIISKSIKNFLTLEATATHATFIHEGTRTISPDPWIEQTILDNDKLIRSTIDKHINIAIKEINS